jgi:hypothetical protein
MLTGVERFKHRREVTTCNPIKASRCCEGTYQLYLGYNSTPSKKPSINRDKEATCPSETCADFYRTTRCHVPADRTLHSHRCENLKFDMKVESKFDCAVATGAAAAEERENEMDGETTSQFP